MSDEYDMQSATKREWLAAKIVVVGGLIVAVGVAGYFAWQQYSAPQIQETSIPAQTQQAQPQMTAAQRANYNANIGAVVCAMELAGAQGLGVVPAYSKLVNNILRADGPRGRYSCVAGTHVAQYKLAADLVCRELTDPRCVRLYSVTRDDGVVIFKAPK
jgi:Flp pilus assembly protein CpaB